MKTPLVTSDKKIPDWAFSIGASWQGDIPACHDVWLIDWARTGGSVAPNPANVEQSSHVASDAL